MGDRAPWGQSCPTLTEANKMTNETKRVPVVTTEFDEQTGEMSVVFSDGRRHSFLLEDTAPEIRLRATVHGFNAKLVDAAAIARDTTTGRAATLETKYQAVMEVFTRITDPTAPMWNKVREGAGGGNGNLLVAAIVRLYNGRKTEEQIRAYLNTLTDAQRQSLRTDGKIAPIIAEIKAEREIAKGKAAGIDSRTVLAGLDEFGEDEEEQEEQGESAPY